MYHFGHTSPAENLTLYNHCISKLAAAVDLRCKANRKACVSGVIVNACGSVSRPVAALPNRSLNLPFSKWLLTENAFFYSWIRGGGYQSILTAAKEFEIDVVIVLDQERLYKELERDLPKYVGTYLNQPWRG